MSGPKWSSLTESCTKCLIVLLVLQSSQVLGRSVANLNVGYEWVHVDVRNGIPGSAFQGGHDTGGQPIYVGRALHEGDLLPAKVIPDYKAAWVSYNGTEQVKYDIEVLVQNGANFQWMAGTNGDVPPDAMVGGYTVDGETLFIGRADLMGSKTVGKVQVSQRGINVAYGGSEKFMSDYDILVRD